MDVTTQVRPYFEWLFWNSGDGLSALVHFLLTALVLLLLVVGVTFLIATFRHGPVAAGRSVGRALGQGAVDLALMSPRRLLGLAMLAVREAFRRFIWVVLVLFVVILLFAGWFLHPSSDEPAKLYLNFVLNATTYLMLALALYLSSLSLPADIKSRSIYTIVTKPVRASEIVLGRILGFTFACSVLLAIMCAASYVFVSRALQHSHQVATEDVSEEYQHQQLAGYNGQTTTDSDHRHTFHIAADAFSPGVELADNAAGQLEVRRVTAAARAAGVQEGDVVESIDGQRLAAEDLGEAEQLLEGPPGSSVQLGVLRGDQTLDVELKRLTAQTNTESVRGHTHPVVARYEEGKLNFEVGDVEGMLAARVPIFGDLRFRDRRGDEKNRDTWSFSNRGISVGKIYNYRSYIQGNTMAAAIWTFKDLREADYPDGLPLDLNIRVYRGHKGEIDQGIAGSLQLVNPKNPNVATERILFTAKEFQLDRIHVPRFLRNTSNQPIDLFRDVVTPDGEVEVWISCEAPGQYFGMARSDVYVRGQDASYTLNFIKAFVEVWLQVLVIISLAVLFSTFLSGPVAILLTVTTILMGYSSKFIYQLTCSVIYRDEMKAADRLRQAGFGLDTDGFKQAAEWKAANLPDFTNISIKKLEAVGSLELDQVSVLDRVYGGGPLEAFYRIVTQDNLVRDLEPGWGTSTIQWIDSMLMHVMQYLLHVLPDFSRFNDAVYLAHGYNIQGAMLAQQATMSLAFVAAAFVAGYFVMKYREVAA